MIFVASKHREQLSVDIAGNRAQSNGAGQFGLEDPQRVEAHSHGAQFRVSAVAQSRQQPLEIGHRRRGADLGVLDRLEILGELEDVDQNLRVVLGAFREGPHHAERIVESGIGSLQAIQFEERR